MAHPAGQPGEPKSLRVAVIDFGETEAQSLSLTTPIAGLPLVLRILLPLRRVGVNTFLLLGRVGREILPVLEEDPRLEGQVQAVTSLDPVRSFANGPLIILRGIVALEREILDELARRAEKESIFYVDPETDGESGPSGWHGIGVISIRSVQDHIPSDDLPTLLQTLRAKGLLRVQPAKAELLWTVRHSADAEIWEHRLFAKLEARHGRPWFQHVVNRRVSAWTTRHLVSTPITPNQVTVASLAIGLLAAACFLPDSFGWSLVGWLLFELSYVLDCADGELARLKMQESAVGAWIDSMADNVVQAAILFFLGVRLQRSTGHWGFLALGAGGAVGMLITGAVVTHFFVRDKGLRLADVRTGWIGRLGLWRLGASLEQTANRDPFALALLAAVVFNRVDLFLWVAAVGVNAYLALLLLLKRATHREAIT
jgi:hypothetical protein